MKTSLIPSKLYKQIIESVPVLCVDVVLMHEDHYVLVKRNNEPLKGEWWVIGGRVLKDETLKQAVIRKVKEETGLRIEDIKFTGIYEDSYPKSAFGIPTHTVSVVFTAQVKDFKPKLDSQSTGIKLAKLLPDRFETKYVEI